MRNIAVFLCVICFGLMPTAHANTPKQDVKTAVRSEMPLGLFRNVLFSVSAPNAAVLVVGARYRCQIPESRSCVFPLLPDTYSYVLLDADNAVLESGNVTVDEKSAK